MFGSVTSRDLTEQLKKAGVDLDHRQIVLEAPIKALGKYEVQVKLASGVSATLKFFVVAKAK
jgi:large subunit ribosomal protein L9